MTSWILLVQNTNPLQRKTVTLNITLEKPKARKHNVNGLF